MARLSGRLDHGLAPWRRRHLGLVDLPRARRLAIWSENWRSADERLRGLADEWRSQDVIVVAGGPCDRWDLEVRCGLFGAARLRMALEDHPGGTQLVRIRVFPRAPWSGRLTFVAAAALAAGAAADGAHVVAAVIATVAVVVALSVLFETAAAFAVMLRTFRHEAAATAEAEAVAVESALQLEEPDEFREAATSPRVGD